MKGIIFWAATRKWSSANKKRFLNHLHFFHLVFQLIFRQNALHLITSYLNNKITESGHLMQQRGFNIIKVQRNYIYDMAAAVSGSMVIYMHN